jgi:hypothetical protein
MISDCHALKDKVNEDWEGCAFDTAEGAVGLHSQAV